MPEDIVVVGAGGFGRETLDVIEAINDASGTPIWRVVGVADDRPAPVQVTRLDLRGYQHLGPVAAVANDFAPAVYVVGIGSPAVRARIVRDFDLAGWHAATLVHPSASVGSAVAINEGAVVCSGVQLSTNTRLGRHVHLNPGAIVGHDSRLGNFVSVNPGAVVSGEVDIEEGALVGAGAVILQGLRVGQCSIVGASGCVTRDVPAFATVKGVPAR